MKKGKTYKVFTNAFVILTAVLIVVPFLFLISKIKLQDIYKLLFEDFWFYPVFWNSVLYSFAIGCLSTAVAFLSAFAISKGRFRHKKKIQYLLLLLMLLPLQTTLLPNYLGLRDLNLLNTRSAMILPMIFFPFAIYLMTQYMDSLSDDCIEAARMETNSVFIILLKIVLPQMRVCISAVFLFMFAEGFNMVEQSIFYLKDDKLKPLAVMEENIPAESTELKYIVGIICIVLFLLFYLLYEDELQESFSKLSD